MRETATLSRRSTLPLRRLRLGQYWRELLALLGLPVALVGQHLLANRVDAVVGGVLLVLGAALFVAAAWGLPLDRAATTAADADSVAPPAAGLRRWLIGLAPGMLLGAVGVALFVPRGVSASLAWLVWGVGVLVAAVLGWRVAGCPRPRFWPARELAIVAALTLLGACFRLYRLSELPAGLWWDEAVGGLETVKILQDPSYRPVYVAGLVNSPSLWFYLSALFVAWLGPIPEAVRSAALLGGILYPPAIYALARGLFGVRAAIPAAAIAAVLLWNVNFSRNGWNYAWTVSLDALAMALLIRAVQLRRPGAALAGGMVWGLALHGYNPARLILPVALAFVVMSGRRAPRQFFRDQATVLALYALGALLVIAPLVAFVARRPDEYLSRAQQVFIMNEVRSAGSWDPLVSSVRQHLLMFNVAGDRNGRHNLPGAPMLDQVTAALFVVGLGLALVRLNRPGWVLLPIWCLVGVAAGALTLAFEAPQALRGIEAMTPAILLAGAALGAFTMVEQSPTGQPPTGQPTRGQSGTSTPSKGRATPWAPEIVGAIVVAIVGLNYHAYFVRKANDFASWAAYSAAERIVAEQAAALAPTHTVYLDETWLGHPTIRFLAPNLGEHKRFDPVANVPIQEDGPVAIFVSGERPALVNDLDRLYPDGGTERITAPVGGSVVVRSVLVPPEAIRDLRGVNVRVSVDGRERSTREVIGSMDVEWPGASRQFEPADVELGAVVSAPKFGRYRLGVDGPPGAVVEIDGQPVVGAGGAADVQLARGNHRVVVAARFDQPGRLRLLWTLPGESDARPIPPELLSRSVQAARGLLASYRQGSGFDAPPQTIQVERHLQRRVHLVPLPRPYTVEWIGTIDVARTGVHSFWIDAIGKSWLWIDDRPIFSDVVNASPEASVHLSQGSHSVRVRFADTDQFSRFDVQWRPPEGDRESIPTSRLSPPEGVVESPPPPPMPATAALQAIGEATVRWLYSSPGEVRGVGVAPDGTVYAVDTQRRLAQRLGEFGQPTVEMSGGLVGEPVDIDVGPDGRPVVLDAEQGWPVRFEADGSRPTQIGGPALRLFRPRGLGIGRDGAIYVANTGGNQIVKIAPDGAVLGRFGPNVGGPDELRQPTDVAVGPNGELYVVNNERNAVVRLDTDGRYVTQWAVATADTLRGNHIAVGPDGGIYVTEPSRGRVVRFGPDGQPAGIIESVRQGRLLRTPVGVAVGPDGVVYVADPGLKGVVALALEGSAP